jgi:hypothetical protein
LDEKARGPSILTFSSDFEERGHEEYAIEVFLYRHIISGYPH